MKKLFVLLITLFSFSSVFALELCTPSEEYQEYMKLSDEEKLNYIEPPYCSEIGNNLSSITYRSAKSVGASSTDSNYNAKDAGFVSSV